MATRIQQGIEELEHKLHSERAIAEQFPDATLAQLEDGRWVWVSPKVGAVATDFDLIQSKDDHRGTMLRAYVTVEGMRVYADHWLAMSALSLLDKIKREHAEVYKMLVAIAAKGFQG
jgi:hypothetical protein